MHQRLHQLWQGIFEQQEWLVFADPLAVIYVGKNNSTMNAFFFLFCRVFWCISHGTLVLVWFLPRFDLYAECFKPHRKVHKKKMRTDFCPISHSTIRAAKLVGQRASWEAGCEDAVTILE